MLKNSLWHGEWVSVPGGHSSAAAVEGSGSRTSSHPECTLTGLTESKIIAAMRHKSNPHGISKSTTHKGHGRPGDLCEMDLSEGFNELFLCAVAWDGIFWSPAKHHGHVMTGSTAWLFIKVWKSKRSADSFYHRQSISFSFTKRISQTQSDNFIKYVATLHIEVQFVDIS